MKEKKPEVLHSEFENIYDQHENGIGSVPGEHVPGIFSIKVSGLKNETGFRNAMRRRKVRGEVNRLHEEGKKVAATWSAGEITLFIADKAHFIKDHTLPLREHKKELAEGIVVAAAIVGTTIYFTRRSRQVK